MRLWHIALVFGILFLIVVGLWTANFLGYIYPSQDGTNEHRGAFGDTFGSINALFAGLAFAGIAVSIFIQSNQLQVSRTEMKAAQDTFVATSTNLKKQSFETTFFNLFESFTNLVQNFEANATRTRSFRGRSKGSGGVQENIIVGRQVFERYLDLLDGTYRSKLLEHRTKIQEKLEAEGRLDDALTYTDDMVPIETKKDIAIGAYRALYTQYGDDLGQYFRTLYTIIRYVRFSNLEDDEKPFYVKLIRAQLSSHEATILALNYTIGKTTTRFNQMADEYGLLKNCHRKNTIFLLFLDGINLDAFGREAVWPITGRNTSELGHYLG